MAMRRFGTLVFVLFTAVGCNSAEPTEPAQAPAQSPPAAAPPAAATPQDPLRAIRQAILDELRPVALKNCTVKRYGSKNDGGYLMCENLVAGTEGLYSYGIAEEDNWGCEVSAQVALPVHQYDCFTDQRPRCKSARPIFHDECIGPKAEKVKGKPFDTLANHIARNGHSGKRVIVKMDVEDSEWDSLMATPDEVLERIDQLPIEFHGANEQRFLDTIRKLKRTFHVVSLHFNNHACTPDAAPLPAWAYQALLVNKRLGELDPTRPGRQPGSPPDAPDSPDLKSWPDCQPRF